MGHRSNAVDKYQITSDQQREAMSNIIANQIESMVHEQSPNAIVIEAKSNENKELVEVKTGQSEKTVNVTPSSVCGIITSVLECSSKCGKSTVKIQIEVINE